jgi:ribosomal protein L16/L10AE
MGGREVDSELETSYPREINKLLARSGSLWQRDYFDRLVRDKKHFGTCVRYIRRNPKKARLGEGQLVLYESGTTRSVF